MVEAAAQQGYPFLMHSVPLTGRYNNFFCGECYERFHSAVFGMEVNHSLLVPTETAESGMAIVRSLLMEGNGRAPWEQDAGYPNRILIGDFFTSIRPVGKDAAQRRTSRSALWQQRQQFSMPIREFVPPSTIRVEIKRPERSLPSSFALVCRIRGFPDLKAAQLDGVEVEAATYRDNCSTYVSVEIPPDSAEKRKLHIRW